MELNHVYNVTVCSLNWRLEINSITCLTLSIESEISHEYTNKILEFFIETFSMDLLKIPMFNEEN